MSPDEFEEVVRTTAADWAYIQWISLLDKTEHALKMRLHIDSACFVQVYANPQKTLWSYTLVLNRTRIFGRDCDGGRWITAHVVALEQPYVYNRFGTCDPSGMVFALRRDVLLPSFN